VAAPESSPSAVLPLPIRISVLLLLTVLTAVYCVAIVIPGLVYLTVPLGLLTLLFTPGYGLVAIGAGERERWPWYFTTIVVVGLSVAFNVAIGLLLVYGSYGLLPLVLAISSLFVLFLGGVAQFTRYAGIGDTRFVAMVRTELGLSGFSRSQKAAAIALLVAILLVIAGLTYIASVNPREKSDVTFGITGPQGSAIGLPIGYPTMAPTTLVVTVGNNLTAQSWTLRVTANATLAGDSNKSLSVPPTVANQSIPWSSPLYLGDGIQSETTLGLLSPNQVITFNVTLQFNSTLTNATGSITDYTVTFELVPSEGGSPVRVASWYYEIKVVPRSSSSGIAMGATAWP
jgi:uncharacterized membrane protein